MAALKIVTAATPATVNVKKIVLAIPNAAVTIVLVTLNVTIAAVMTVLQKKKFIIVTGATKLHNSAERAGGIRPLFFSSLIT